MRPSCSALLLAAMLTGTAFATPSPGTPAEEPLLPVLEIVYLQCDREARQRLLGFGEAAHCSRVAEELLHRRFGGDFARLLAWWRTQRDDALASSAGR